MPRGRVRREWVIRTSRWRATAATTSRHYRLAVAYDPDTDRLEGVARIRATATQSLSRFNLDLDGLKVRSVTVGGHRADWTRDGGELRVTPARPLRDGQAFRTVCPVRRRARCSCPYGPGVIPTDDGALVLGEPQVRVDLVPGERPPDRQGVLHDRGDRAAAGSRRSATAPWQSVRTTRRLVHLDVERPRADGALPRHRVDR